MYSQLKGVRKCNSGPFMQSFQVLHSSVGQSEHTQSGARKPMWYQLQKEKKKQQEHCSGGTMMWCLKYKVKKSHSWLICATHLLDPL